MLVAGVPGRLCRSVTPCGISSALCCDAMHALHFVRGCALDIHGCAPQLVLPDGAFMPQGLPLILLARALLPGAACSRVSVPWSSM